MDFGHSSFNGGWQEVWVRSYEIRITSAGIVFYRIPFIDDLRDCVGSRDIFRGSDVGNSANGRCCARRP